MNCLPRNSVIIFWLIFFLLGNVFAQIQDRRFVALKEKPEFTIKPGEEKELLLSFLIKEGFHIQANRVDDENLIPTVLSFEDAEELTIGDPVYPEADAFKMRGVDAPLRVFGELLEIKIPVRAVRTIQKGTILIKGNLHYQPCDASKCYYPRDLEFNMRITIRHH